MLIIMDVVIAINLVGDMLINIISLLKFCLVDVRKKNGNCFIDTNILIGGEGIDLISGKKYGQVLARFIIFAILIELYIYLNISYNI